MTMRHKRNIKKSQESNALDVSDLPLFKFAEALENHPARKQRPALAVNHLRRSRGLSYAHAKLIAERHYGIADG
ncbi:MAG: hypothetical protein ACSHXY_04745 [Alphaproteobacteria bacterium]